MNLWILWTMSTFREELDDVLKEFKDVGESNCTEEQARQIARVIVKKLVKKFFKDPNGRPFEMTDGQADIFLIIFLKLHLYNQVITSTQYGKSEVVAMAVIMRALAFREDWTLISGTNELAQIIMRKVVGHMFDHPSLEAQIDQSLIDHKERIKHHRSSDYITFKNGGSVRTISTQETNSTKLTTALTGQGGKNIIQDESSIIMDASYAMTMRMLGGQTELNEHGLPVDLGFILKIGNPFNNNHFRRTWDDETPVEQGGWNKLFIDHHQALREGRYTQAFIDKMEKELLFSILYACEFPDEDDIEDGFARLIKSDLFNNALVSPAEAPDPMGVPNLGCDFAGGGNDSSAYVLRYDNIMRLLSTNDSDDTMFQVQQIIEYQEQYDIPWKRIACDAGGLGKGIPDRLKELHRPVTPIMFGESPPQPHHKTILNMRAYMYLELKAWLEAGGKIIEDPRFTELLLVKYKTNAEKKLQLQSKDNLKAAMRKAGMKATSPDVGDAAALTFAKKKLLTADKIG